MQKYPAEFLLIDIGNTQVKLRRANDTTLPGRLRRLPTARLLGTEGAAALRQALLGWQYERVVLASVVPAAARKVLAGLDRPVLTVTPGLDIGVDLNGYPGRRTLGADRLADLAAAWDLYGPARGPDPLIVADLGTAAVFNAIDAQGVFLGGMIAPGLAALHASLPARTAQLPKVNPRGAVPALGRTTEEALLAGGYYAFRGMIREILAALRAEIGEARLVATGGDAHLLAGLVSKKDTISSELTLEGLRIIGVRNPGQSLWHTPQTLSGED